MPVSAATTTDALSDRAALHTDLEKMLAEDLAAVRSREQTAFDQQVGPFATSLVLFGAGGLGRKTLAGLRKLGIEPLAFADNNPLLWHHQVDGLEVLPVPEAVHKLGRRAAFITTIWKGEATDRMGERQQQLRDLGCSTVLSFGPLFWKYPHVFLPHYAADLPHKVHEARADVVRAFSLWADDASRQEYHAQVRWRALHDFDGLPAPVSHVIYFPDDLVSVSAQEAFVDCGAYDGDTLQSFLRRQGPDFGSVEAFEPDAMNYQRLQKYVAALPAPVRDKISTHPCAVGARTERVSFTAMGSEASAVGQGVDQIDCVHLDGFLGDRSPSYIKMDIEGSEPDALVGGRALIEKHLPILAVCVYHQQDHLWRIPLLIHSMSDQYRFFLRPHLLEVWDLVCYAIPRHRLKNSLNK
jgi:FkbM family methyltransferase